MKVLTYVFKTTDITQNQNLKNRILFIADVDVLSGTSPWTGICFTSILGQI